MPKGAASDGLGVADGASGAGERLHGSGLEPLGDVVDAFETLERLNGRADRLHGESSLPDGIGDRASGRADHRHGASSDRKGAPDVLLIHSVDLLERAQHLHIREVELHGGPDRLLIASNDQLIGSPMKPPRASVKLGIEDEELGKSSGAVDRSTDELLPSDV